VLAWRALGAINAFDLPNGTACMLAAHVVARRDRFETAVAAGAPAFIAACQALHTVQSCRRYVLEFPLPEPHLPQPPVQSGYEAAAMASALCRGCWLHLGDAAATAAALTCLVSRFPRSEWPEVQLVQLLSSALALHPSDAHVVAHAAAALETLLQLHALPEAEQQQIRSHVWTTLNDDPPRLRHAEEEANACGAPTLLLAAAAAQPAGCGPEQHALRAMAMLGFDDGVAALVAIARETTTLAVPPPPLAQGNECAVCYDAPRCVALLPCCHVCVCEACAERLLATAQPLCPMCRAPIEHVMHVYV
jgi:hypothetical protein